jgi:peptide/nickel transport system permease protein
MLDVLAEDYVRTARSKGLGETAVLLRHALRNIMVPVLTVIGIQAGRVLSGAVVIETVFSIPGMGRLMVQSVLNRDYAVLQALLIVFVFTYLIINFLVDIANVMLDPRLRSDVLRG